ncbi:Uu.00g082210.m01.CDS01 [Anthostomella pinea]|uniref:Uu.00g082210.m01.CDS01 n=1 Tax=Anthostomella pinea TaxID=933095 RepID=A0AAI8YJH2_9PEZI|nr:Uu.00g082210.m01.CDS01 [Anthostomella pinea]
MAGSNEKNAQPRGSSFGPATWQSNQIWGNGSIIGSSLSSHRETSGSRGITGSQLTGLTASEEALSNVPSGSAQLNHHSEAVQWPSRGAIWNRPSTSSHGHSNSGSTSPTRTRDSFQQHSFPDANSSVRSFQPRTSVSQNGPGLQNRTMPPGPADNSGAPFRYTSAFGESVGEERGNPGLYGTMGNSQLGLDAPGIYRRNSTDPNFLNLGATRSTSLTSRQPETDTSTPPNLYGESSQYPFTKGSGHSIPQGQRSSVRNHSAALSSEASRGNAYYVPAGANDQDLDDGFNRALNLNDNSESATPSAGAYAHNGYPNPASQPFQFNPGSQPWHNDQRNNGGGFGQGVQQDAWAEPMNAHYGSKRGSVERSSPAGSSYRQGLNSPRGFTGTPNPRPDPWNRPGSSRDRRTQQDVDRQYGAQYGSQYSQQAAGFFPTPYYNSHQIPSYPAAYENPYAQVNGFRPQIPTSSYGLPTNFMQSVPIPVRPSRDMDPSRGARSVLLEEFRGSAKSNKSYELKDIYNHIVEFSGDQHGSRFIQEKLQTANSDEKEQVFREFEPNALQLMKDVFGNYVIQKFFEHGNQVQKKVIAAQMKGKIAELSTQMYACRVVQKALEHVLVEQQTEIVEELKSDIVRICKDLNGNHVIQKVIQTLPRACIPSILNGFRGGIEGLASHSYGCRVIQRILEHCTDAEKKSLMADLHACAPKLIADTYGNYVAQHIIEFGEPEDRSRMIRHVIDRVLILSKHKYASNVVEKCIGFGTAEERSAIRVKLTAPPNGDGISPLLNILKDQYGNYVVQKLFHSLKEGSEYDDLREEVRPLLPALRKQFNNRQMAAIEKIVGSSPATTSTTSAAGVAAAASPGTPYLHVDVNSSAPTPSLTMEQNSPQSSSPPSTNISTVEEVVDDKTRLVHESGLEQGCQTVQVDDEA